MPTVVLLSLTTIHHSHRHGRSCLQLVYGTNAADFTMWQVLCLRDAAEGGKGIEIYALEDGTVHMMETFGLAPRGRNAETHRISFTGRMALQIGGTMIGGFIPTDERSAIIELCNGVIMETQPRRYVRCAYCLHQHNFRDTAPTVCGLSGCRALIPPLTVPYNPGALQFAPIAPLAPSRLVTG